MKKKNTVSQRTAAAIMAACWLLSPLTATAEQPGEQTDYTLPETIITATRTEQTIKETPSTVQVITREQIEQRQYQNLSDALQDAVGIVTFNDFQNRANLSIRGSESRHVLIMVDGRRLSGETSFNSANAFDIDRIRLDNVERVEIIRGSAGALYGSDAIGGVINIITKKVKKNEGRLNYQYSAWDGLKAAGPSMQFYYQGINDSGNFAWSLTAGQQRPKPFDLAANSTANYYGKQAPLALSGTWTFTNNNWLKLDYSKLYEKTETKYILPSQGPGMPNIPRLIKNDDTRTDWSLEYGGKNERRDWQIRAYQSKYDKDYSSYQTVKMGMAPAKTSLSMFDLLERKISVLEGRDSWQMADNQRITAGFEWRKDETEGTRIKRPGRIGSPVSYTTPYGSKTNYSDNASLEYRSMYLQDEITAGDRWLVIPSLRYDWSDLFSSEITPQVGATYKIRDDLRLKTVVGKGYKTPTVNELYHYWEMVAPRGTTAGEFWQGNPDVKPEKSTNYEISLEKDWENSHMRVGMFRNEIKDLIEGFWDGTYTTDSRYGDLYKGYGKDKLRTYVNVPEAAIQGFETEFSRKITDDLSLRLGYVYLDARNKTSDTRLENRPRHQMNVGLTYQPPQSSWLVRLDLVGFKDYWTTVDDIQISEGAVEDDQSKKKYKNESYSIINLMVQNAINKNTMLYVGVDNLSDHIEYNHGFIGRVYRTGVQYKF